VTVVRSFMQWVITRTVRKPKAFDNPAQGREQSERTLGRCQQARVTPTGSYHREFAAV
jgi:hypothetical protein